MYCPFQKITTNMNDSGYPINLFNTLIVSVEEKFNECFKDECAAWDEEHKCCLLCRGHTLKEI